LSAIVTADEIAGMLRILGGHAYNPSYSGGKDQEDCSLKPAWANSSWDPILKKPSQKRAGGVAQGVGPESNLSITHTQKRILIWSW
jgi:hypothetical protein